MAKRLETTNVDDSEPVRAPDASKFDQLLTEPEFYPIDGSEIDDSELASVLEISRQEYEKQYLAQLEILRESRMEYERQCLANLEARRNKEKEEEEARIRANEMERRRVLLLPFMTEIARVIKYDKNIQKWMENIRPKIDNFSNLTADVICLPEPLYKQSLEIVKTMRNSQVSELFALMV